MTPASHLYVHVPFCAHRCGYCDFVTVTGREAQHAPYVDAVLREHALRRDAGDVGERPDTVYLGGGTPSLLGADLLARLLDGLPTAAEVTVECNPETVTAPLAGVLAERGCRVSLGVQSFDADLLRTLERRAAPDAVRRSVETLREAGIANLSLDLIYGVPGERAATLAGDLDEILALAPEHVSAYELEAKPGTRFTHRHGAELRRQEDLLEDHFERVVARLEAGGYRWYETASFARPGREGRHNRAYWLGRDYLGIGVGAVSTIGLERRANGPRLRPYLAALAAGSLPPARVEVLTPRQRSEERLMLGLRLAEGVERRVVEDVLDAAEARRLQALGLVREADARIVLSRRGRQLANGVVARLLRDDERDAS